MKKIGAFLIVLSVLSALNCQQAMAASGKTSEVGRKEKLMAAENINLKAELAQTKSELEKQIKSLDQCRQDNEKKTVQAAVDANEIKNLKTDLTQCRKELETLKKEIEQCQKMVDLTDVPALCKDKVEKQKKLLRECQKEKEAISKAAAESSSFLMEQLPTDLLKEVEKLTAENEQLKARISELEKCPADTKTPKE